MTPENDAGKPRRGKKYIDSKDIFEGQREVCILHEGQEYRLIITRAGKLILNK